MERGTGVGQLMQKEPFPAPLKLRPYDAIEIRLLLSLLLPLHES